MATRSKTNGFAMTLIGAAISMMSFMARADEPPSLNTLVDSVQSAPKATAENDIPPIRLNAIKEAALGYGVRSGLARRTFEIDQILADNESMLDGIYNFAAMLVDRNVMPPVLVESRSNLKLNDSETIRVADATYRIERQARFVTSPTNWREYLRRTYKAESDRPADILFPKTEFERTIWQAALREGWQLGVNQANQIFTQSLARLERDYKGMIIYRSLLAKGMISRPYVAEANLGVTGDANSISINDRILRITAVPQLEKNPARWKAIPVPK